MKSTKHILQSGILTFALMVVTAPAHSQTISATYLQPVVAYTSKMHTTFALNTESTYDWENSQWSVPLNLMVAQVFKIGKLPGQLQQGLVEASAKGWTVVSMKNDWKTIFPPAPE